MAGQWAFCDVSDRGRGEDIKNDSPRWRSTGYSSRSGDQRIPAAIRRLVELALEHILRTPVVKTEDHVLEIQAIHDEPQAMHKAYAPITNPFCPGRILRQDPRSKEESL